MPLKKIMTTLFVSSLLFVYTSPAYALSQGDAWTDELGIEYSVRYVQPEDQRIVYPEAVAPLGHASGAGSNELTNGADWYGLTWSEDGSDSIGVYVYRTDSDGNIPKFDNIFCTKKAFICNCYDSPKTVELFELPDGDLFVEAYSCTNSSSPFDDNENFDILFALVRPTETSFEVLKNFTYNSYRSAGLYVDHAEGAEVDFKSSTLLGGHRDDLALETVAKIADQFFADDNLSFSSMGAYAKSVDGSYQVPMPTLDYQNTDIISVVYTDRVQDLPELQTLFGN